MSRNKSLTVLCSLLLLLASQSASAFDGNRKGFMLSLGFGAHGSEIGSNSQGGLATSFRIGAGIGNRISLYYANHSAYYNADGFLYFSGLTGLGASFHFSPERRSFYVTATVGAATLDSLDDDDLISGNSGDGTGIGLGFGFEVANVLSLEALLMHAKIDYDGFIDEERDHTSMMILANFNFY